MWTVSSRALSSSWLEASCNQYSASYHTAVEEPPPGGPLGSGRRAGQGFPRKESSLTPQQTMVRTVPPHSFPAAGSVLKNLARILVLNPGSVPTPWRLGPAVVSLCCSRGWGHFASHRRFTGLEETGPVAAHCGSGRVQGRFKVLWKLSCLL